METDKMTLPEAIHNTSDRKKETRPNV